jgi:hypothetical protein
MVTKFSACCLFVHPITMNEVESSRGRTDGDRHTQLTNDESIIFFHFSFHLVINLPLYIVSVSFSFQSHSIAVPQPQTAIITNIIAKSFPNSHHCSLLIQFSKKSKK